MKEFVLILRWLIWGIGMALVVDAGCYGIDKNYHGSMIPLCYLVGVLFAILWVNRPKVTK